MKKIFSLLLSVAILCSLSATTAFAEITPLFSIASISTTTATTGDQVSVTLAHKGQSISSLAAYLKFDKTVFELVSICDSEGLPSTDEDSYFGMNYTSSKYLDVALELNSAGDAVALAGMLANGQTKTIYENDNYAVITFRVIGTTSTTANFEMYEGWDSYEDNITQDNTLVDSKTVTITVDDPEPDETIEIDETVKEDAIAGTRTYKVTVGADLKDDGVKAVLRHDDHPDDPQEVGLTFSSWDGEAQAVFDVVVTFLNYTANASKVSFSIIK